MEHDIRFVEDDWEDPTLGVSLGWEVWCDGMEVTQFTYFQQVGGFECDPVSVELTYGVERLAMYVEVENVYNLDWNGKDRGGVSYGDVFHRAEVEYSHYNFNLAETDALFKLFEDAERECLSLKAETGQVLPAYDQCIKASHRFNLLDSGALFRRPSGKISAAFERWRNPAAILAQIRDCPDRAEGLEDRIAF